MADAASIARLITPEATRLGYELVRVRIIGGRRATLQIMAERPDGTMDVDDCATLSRAISILLDQTDPISGEYTLEVSSPGIDRPLTRLRDFAAYQGHEAKVEVEPPLDGRRRFKGIIVRADAGGIVLDVGKHGSPQEFTLPFSSIVEARLVLTDRLVAESLARRNANSSPKPQKA